jgi:hypothetical protein
MNGDQASVPAALDGHRKVHQIQALAPSYRAACRTSPHPLPLGPGAIVGLSAE